MRSLSQKIKYIFLSFAQNYFAQQPNYLWNVDPTKTKIIIADKLATELGIAAMRPTITVSRGPIQWTHNLRNEALPSQSGKPKTTGKGLVENTFLEYRDIIQSSVTFSCLHQRPAEVDHIANELFLALSAYRDDFKPFGILKRTSLQMSDVRPTQVNAEISASQMDISLGFVMDYTVGKVERNFSSKITDYEQLLTEQFDYQIMLDGTAVKFTKDVANPLISYIDAITLEERKDIPLVYDALQKLWIIPNGGVIYGYWEWFKKLNLLLT